MKIKEVSEKLILQNRRGPNPEGSKLLLIWRGPNPEGSCFHKTGGVPIQRGLNFANPEGPILAIRRGTIFANPEGYCFLSTRRGIIFVKGLK